MLKKYFTCLLFLSNSLFGENADPKKVAECGILTNIDSEPTGILDGCINILSGEFFDHAIDLTIAGPEPLKVERTLISNNSSPRFRLRPITWKFSDHQEGVVLPDCVQFEGRNGEYLLFSKARELKVIYSTIDLSFINHGYTNTSQGIIGAQTNVRHHFLTYNSSARSCHLIKPDGKEQIYKEAWNKTDGVSEGYRIEFETRPNTLCFHTKYTTDQSMLPAHHTLNNCKNQLLAEFVNFNDETKKLRTAVVGMDGRQVHYKHQIYSLEHPNFPFLIYKWPLITEADSPEKPKVNYLYYAPKVHVFDERAITDKKHVPPLFELPKLAQKDYPNNRFVLLKYHSEPYKPHDSDYCRLSQLLAPLGSDSKPRVKYSLQYYLPRNQDGCVGVRDALSRLTNYSCNGKHRLTCVTKYFKSDAPYTEEKLHWGQDNTFHEMELQGRTFGKVGASYKTYCRNYVYDERGNIIEDRLYGNLTGTKPNNIVVDTNGKPINPTCDCQVKTHTYSIDKFNLLLTTKEGKLSTQYVYFPGSNLLIASYEKNKSTIYKRNFYDYDDNGQVIKHIIDDGSSIERSDLTSVTQRKIENIVRTNLFPYGLPKEVSEWYLDLSEGVEKLIKKQINQHDLQGHLIAQTTYDSNNIPVYSEKWTYDQHGNVTSHTDPLDYITLFTYDANDNLISELKPNGLLIEYSYDFMNRLIKTHEHHQDSSLIKTFRYDLCGNLVSETDVFGNETTTEFDDFNRPVKILLPAIPQNDGTLVNPITNYDYDEMSNPISITDSKGNITKYKYTLHGKPYYILYPDGSEEHFEYDLKGNLIKEISKNGTTTHYTLDSLERIIKKEIVSSSGENLVTTFATFNTFNLISETDPEGNITSFSYDNQGRKTKTQKGDQITYFEYDSLGRLVRTTQGNTVSCFGYDVLNRIVEERIETCDGKVLTEIRYQYDSVGNKTRIEQNHSEGTSITHVEYDTHGIPILTIDAEKHESYTHPIWNYFNEYGQKVRCLEIIDSMGQTTINVHDALGRLVKQIKKDPFGKIIQETNHIFSTTGKCLKTTHTVFNQTHEIKNLTNLFVYDCMDRLIKIIQAAGSEDEKCTDTIFNLFGEKETVIKPNGVKLIYQYDALGRLINYRTSDNSINYQYVYDQNSRPIRVDDLIHQRSTLKTYDLYGHITEETLANQLTLKMNYTDEGHLKELIFPDQSRIDYCYEGPQLKNITRTNRDLTYCHTYDSYDLAGRLIQSSLAFNQGKLNLSYTNRGELKTISSNFYQENLFFDSIGNLIERNYEDPLGKIQDQFTYDSLYQLTSENGTAQHTYSNDSLYNRTSKNGKKYQINDLNQILSNENSTYKYDLSGNLIRIEGNNSQTFSYDALDRLIALKTDSSTYEFLYDENNRCIEQKKFSGATLISQEKFIYQGQNEIGSLDQNNQFLTLRVLGSGLGAEIGASIAIEISGKPYIPLHDNNGNIICLIDQNGNTCESYRYSAFGEEQIYGSDQKPLTISYLGNPWRFSSKRVIDQFILFGRRFYSPEIGRWMTQDPIGYDGGPNLYAYVSNNPLTHFDLYGLFGNQNGFGNFISRSWNRFSHFFNSAFNMGKTLFNMGRSFVGNTLFKASKELIPFPYIKDIGMVAGHFISNGNIQNYKPSWTEYQTSPMQWVGSGLYKDRMVNHYTNGWATDYEAALMDACAYSHRFDDTATHGVYSGDYGLIGNLMSWTSNALGLLTRASRAVIDNVSSDLHQFNKLGIHNGVISLESHSNGSCINDNAISHLTAIERKHIVACSTGGASIIEPYGLLGSQNYISTRDFVPAITSPIKFTRALFRPASHIVFMPCASDRIVDHAFTSKTYSNARDNYKKFIDSKVL